MPIADRLLAKHCKKQGKENLIFDASAQQKIQQYAWPGNVRELDNVVQRALIIQTGSSISASDIVINATPSTGAAVASLPMNELNASSLHEAHGVSGPEDLGDSLKNREYSLILDALKTEKNKKMAAEKLGISPRTLRYKMAQMREQGIDFHSGLAI